MYLARRPAPAIRDASARTAGAAMVQAEARSSGTCSEFASTVPLSGTSG
ncbi:MAG: hypothetical protein JWL91_619 [Sphingomonas bacterium]|nr:hypothetical protein [Sphingomonas bacterium]